MPVKGYVTRDLARRQVLANPQGTMACTFGEGDRWLARTSVISDLSKEGVTWVFMVNTVHGS